MEVGKVTVELEALDTLRLPEFKGSTFRGALGRMLKQMSCIRRDRDCTCCSISQACSYTYLFETGRYFGKEGLKAAGGVPQPFVLEPPIEELKLYPAGSRISFGLVLIGKGVDYLPYFLAVFERMGESGMGKGRGRFQLFRVADGIANTTVYEQEKGAVNSRLAVVSHRDWAEIGSESADRTASTCLVRLLTPLRLKQEGSLSRSLNFELLIRAILRRLVYLNQFFGTEELKLDFRSLLAQAREVRTESEQLQWRDWERYSSRTDRKMKLGGLIGELRFQGEIQPFRRLLEFGELVHIGKNSTFGLGKYRCNFEMEE